MIRRVVQALFFYPRGGSAQVVRYLSAALLHHGVDCRVVSGSLGDAGERTNAATFFREVTVAPIDYGLAIEAAARGSDPFLEPIPLHPSYEDRVDAPDRIFTSVAPDLAERLETSWAELLRELVDPVPDVFHLHHLTPMQAAVRANWPGVPIIGHLHGTELNMIAAATERLEIAKKLGIDLTRDAESVAEVAAGSAGSLSESEHEMARSTRWEYWRYAIFWRQRMLHYAGLCDRFVVLSDEAREEAARVLDFDMSLIHPMRNGVDVARFRPETLTTEERLRRWQRWLVDEPQGWDESGRAGTVGYTEKDLEKWFVDESGDPSTVLLFVGRFVRMKRVPLLIRAYKKAQERFTHRAPLVIWGGSPGEWEDEHPVTVARQEQVPGVFFVGWRGHGELPDGLNAADIMVAPSTNEPFGQVYIEAMACALPVVGTRSGGPLSFVNTHDGSPNGWLVEPDDVDALADALVEAVNDPEERRRRGDNAYHQVREEYSWDRIAGEFVAIYDGAVEQMGHHSTSIAGDGEGEKD